ncbi:O-antigen ligase family protein [Candidatus Saccharibacteria bacterium]|nr:O-antigen ligase family protein [Candidatus Saccharibacteria bacterium]
MPKNSNSTPAHPSHQNSLASLAAKIQLFLLYSFPAVLFCSYYPVFRLGGSSTTNYELSLPLIWLFLYSVLSLQTFIKKVISLYRRKSWLLSFLLFPTYLSLSTFWSPNPLRAILTSGIFWCLIVSSYSVFSAFSRPTGKFSKSTLAKVFLISSSVFCIVCWTQSLLDVLGVSSDITLLCKGCTSRIFGFPHPSGLTIEPQFMGNLLIVPTLYSFYLLFIKKHRLPFSNNVVLIQALLFVSTLFLTFSRGAIYSFGVGLAFMLVYNLIRLRNRRILLAVPLVLAAFVVTLLCQGLFAELNANYRIPFAQAVSTSVSQLSLGRINLSFPDSAPDFSPQSVVLPSEMVPDHSHSSPVFSGYVEESTNIRLRLNSFAIQSASSTPTSLLFGYGLGSTGHVLYAQELTSSPMEIVQNEYLSLLLETGLLGLALSVVMTAVVFALIKKTLPQAKERFFLYSVILSFALSLLFFSGLPNALHLYLFPVFLCSLLRPSSQTQTYHTPRN